jgi:hypothetical protein
MVLALAVLGLPFISQKGKHEVAGTRVGKFTFKAATPVTPFTCCPLCIPYLSFFVFNV